MGKNVTIVDNFISPKGVFELSGITFTVCKSNGCLQSGEMHIERTRSHGTICSAILVALLPACFEMTGFSCYSDERNADIHKVCASLQYCSTYHPDFLCMSIGSTNWLETKKLANLTKELADAGTKIFAACANDRHITFPSAYPWVTGVRFEPGLSGLYREEASPIGCNIVVGEFTTSVLENLARENRFFKFRTNSMATPYALGTMVAKKLAMSDLPKWTGGHPAKEIPEIPMPIIALRGPLKKLKDLLFLFQEENYRAALLTDRQDADWTSMVLRINAEDFLAWILPLAEASILLLDTECSLASLSKYADNTLDLHQLDTYVAYTSILQFFGREDHDNEKY